MGLIECVPNVSEGRRAPVITTLANAVSIRGVYLLDRSPDPSHNRTVYTFAGQPQRLQEAVLRLFSSAIELIDLRHHEGVHPRIGAVDVVPFVPLEGASMTDCVELSRATAELIARRFQLPVYLYEEAASRPGRRNLAAVRRGGLEGLAARMRQDEWLPDFGPHQPHRSAGASAIGARPILIAYNVNLDADRLDVARRIASKIRASGGGFNHVQAMGVRLVHRGIVQVSMNLTDYHRTSMETVFEAVVREAAADGVAVLESEIVGLVPADALPPDPVTRLKLPEAQAGKILERRLEDALARG
jgi:glutamate formiminotransferase / 5-formyltetrahydrofolate cyclo-ligase